MGHTNDEHVSFVEVQISAFSGFHCAAQDAKGQAMWASGWLGSVQQHDWTNPRPGGLQHQPRPEKLRRSAYKTMPKMVDSEGPHKITPPIRPLCPPTRETKIPVRAITGT